MNFSIVEMAEKALTKPDDFGYWGPKDMFVTWGFTGHHLTGMSTILDKANFKVIRDDLMQEFPNNFRIENYTHWAAGYVDQLVCRVLKEPGEVTEENITEAFEAAIAWHVKLDDYPVLDEFLYSEMDMLANFKFINDLPYKYMFNENDSDWQGKLLESLEVNMNFYVSMDSCSIPNDWDIMMAAYKAELWDPENIDVWEDFCKDNGLEFPPRKKNINQLSLFGDEK